MFRRPLLRLFWLAPFWVAYPGFGADGGSAPVKLAVEISAHAVRQDEKIVIQVSLLSAANQPVRAPKAFPVLLQARQASGRVDPLETITIPAGQTFNNTAVSLPGSGLVYVWAKNTELLPGGAYVRVRSASQPTRPAAGGNVLRPPASEAPVSPGGVRPPIALQPLPQPPPQLHTLPQITLRYSPDRAFLADGKDAVSIEAFLTGAIDTLPSDLRLNVYDSSNSLKPAPLTIRAGDPVGQSLLTSSAPGMVTVEFLGSNPAAALDGDKKLSIKFVPPITQIHLVSSPPNISLVDRAELVVTLTDDQQRPLATSAARDVAFSIVTGKGRIEQRNLQVPAGHFECRTGFTPEWPGEVTIAAATPNFLTVTTNMQVSVPVMLLLCSAAGGVIGGMLSQRTRRKSDQWRGLIGLVTGFLFYWACVFLGITVAKREVVLNPLSALALSAIGGWLQTKVFNLVWSAVRTRSKTA